MSPPAARPVAPEDIAAAPSWLVEAAAAGRVMVIESGRDLDQRDQLVRAIRRQHFVDMLPSEAARALADAWANYVATIWPTDRDIDRPPHPDSLRDAFRLLTKANVGRALKWRQIVNIFDGARW